MMFKKGGDMTSIISMFVGGLFFIIVGLSMLFSAFDSISNQQAANITDLSGIFLIFVGLMALGMGHKSYQGYKENRQIISR